MMVEASQGYVPDQTRSSFCARWPRAGLCTDARRAHCAHIGPGAHCGMATNMKTGMAHDVYRRRQWPAERTERLMRASRGCCPFHEVYTRRQARNLSAAAQTDDAGRSDLAGANRYIADLGPPGHHNPLPAPRGVRRSVYAARHLRRLHRLGVRALCCRRSAVSAKGVARSNTPSWLRIQIDDCDWCCSEQHLVRRSPARRRLKKKAPGAGARCSAMAP